MGITSSTKELNTGTIPCGGTFEVTLGLTAAPDIVSNPTDIVLILDRSGSMSGKPLDNLKRAQENSLTSSTRRPTARRTDRLETAVASAL